MTRLAWCLAALVACGGGGDDPFDGAPDITGRYNVIIGGGAGCENRLEFLSWANGPLEISGEPASTTFVLGGRTMQGSVSSNSTFGFGGAVSMGGADLGVYASGDAFFRAGWWELEGDLGAEVDENADGEPDCTISGPFQAQQVSE